MSPSPRRLLRTLVHMPDLPIPEGRLIDLPGRGTTYATDTPGPDQHSPTILLLHAVGTTGLLTWYPTIPVLAKRFRVITIDQRWHGQGIQSPTFNLRDCADDVAAALDVLGVDAAIIGGYSMGSIVAQRVWRQHPDKVSGLVLGATTDRFRTTLSERLFHETMEISMAGLRGLARSRIAGYTTRSAGRALDLELSDIHDWALAEFRSTSPWAVAQAVAALGRHHSRPWLGRIDVPTAVVATLTDRVIPASRQLDLARRIPGATVHGIDCGHAAVVLEAEAFVPAFEEACNTVQARVRDFAR